MLADSRGLWSRMRRRVAGVAVAGLAGSVLVVMAPGAEALAASKATVLVKIQAPSGVPVTAVVSGKTDVVVAKSETASKLSKKLIVKPGAYKVTVDPFTYKGRLYVAEVSEPKLTLAKGVPAKTVVKVKRAKVADRIEVGAIDASSISMTWTQPKGVKTVLRRSSGEVAPSSPTSGTAVKVSGSGATDTGLTSGGSYSYALFTQVKGEWSPPITMTAGTATPGGAEWAAPSSSIIVNPGDADQVVGTSPTSVTVQLAPGRPTPVLGSGMALPISPQLEGGYLGRVTAINETGDQVTVTAGGLADVFNRYHLSADLGELPSLTLDPVSPRKTARTSLRAEETTNQGVATPKSCWDIEGKGKFTLTPTLTLGGKFDSDVVWNRGNPYATLNMSPQVTMKIRADSYIESTLRCEIAFDRIPWTISTSPVPMSLVIEPKASVFVTGKVSMTNVSVSSTVGFGLDAKFWLGGKSARAYAINTASANGGTVAGTATMGVELGGEVTLGPGVASKGVGAVAGVNGDLTLLQLANEQVYPLVDKRAGSCWKLTASTKLDIGVTGKAWLWDEEVLNERFSVPGLNWEKVWGQYVLPSKCDEKPIFAGLGREVAGTGVDQSDGAFSGDARQTGRVEGFGQTAWVLSTGDVGDSIGTPKRQVSTDLGRPGLPALTSLINAPTFDGASYKAVVVPNGPNLSVRFVFASEEYPKYIGGKFNDVAAVYIDGQPCSPNGLSGAISVNQINSTKNSHLFVDNANGAAGYGTTMDGLTVPLTCTKTVTPGTPVTVEFMVADAGDGELDSAIALLDGGITAS